MEGSVIRFGGIRLDVLHTPGHTEGSVCLLAEGERLLFTGDTLFAGGWGRTDLPGGSVDQMVDSLGRLAVIEPTSPSCQGTAAGALSIENARGWSRSSARVDCRCEGGERPGGRAGFMLARGSLAACSRR